MSGRRILVLWMHGSGYLSACLQHLSESADVLFVGYKSISSAPFDNVCLHSVNSIYCDPSDPYGFSEACSQALSFCPDTILCCGVHIPAYISLIREVRVRNPSCVSVLCFDWQWSFNPKNILRVFRYQLLYSNIFDYAFVPGPRQFSFARKLGFPPLRIRTGLYSSGFSSNYTVNWVDRRNSFAFVGRIVSSKGIESLASAWSSVVHSPKFLIHPWSLDIYGVGPLDALFSALPFCNIKGFLQPNDLYHQLSFSKVLVAPSLYEPWGVQIHEASSLGLALLASPACGSTDYLLRHGVNGFFFDPSNPSALAALMLRVMDLDLSGALARIASDSHLFSNALSPYIWARTVLLIATF
jgi:glycosyltransferase involved in cell wall biosynthesis